MAWFTISGQMQKTYGKESSIRSLASFLPAWVLHYSDLNCPGPGREEEGPELARQLGARVRHANHSAGHHTSRGIGNCGVYRRRLIGISCDCFPCPRRHYLVSFLDFWLGWLLYRGGNQLTIKIFLIIATAILYLLAAGMFSKAVWSLQYHKFASKVGSDMADAGNSIGSYDVRETVWHMDCCNPEADNG